MLLSELCKIKQLAHKTVFKKKKTKKNVQKIFYFFKFSINITGPTRNTSAGRWSHRLG